MTANRAWEFLDHYSNSPFATVFGIATAITTVWGVVSVYRDLVQWLGSHFAALLIAGFLGVLVLFVIVSFILPSVRRQYALPLTARFICPEIKRTWEIDSVGNGVMTNLKTYFFYEDPHEEDLIDTVMGSQELTYLELNYQSNDSVPVNHEQANTVMQRIYWKPKVGEVKIGVPYTHHVKSDFPYHGTSPPKSKIMTIIVPVLTLRFELVVKSEIPVQRAVVYKGARWQRFKDHDGIALRGQRVKKTQAPLPALPDKSNLTWAMDKLPGKTVYYLVLYY